MDRLLPALPCPSLIGLAALAGGLIVLRAASVRRLGERTLDAAFAAGLRLLGARDGFIPLV